MDDEATPHAADDEVTRLGSQLVALARMLEQRLEESHRLLQIAEQVESGLFLEDVLTRVYDSFRPVIPYDRIGCALLSDGDRTLTARWARSDSRHRAAILELLGKEIERARRSGEPLGVILADIDHFKRVNDELGHQAGDAVLREVAARLQQAARAYDLVGRYGGEEFLVVLASVKPATARAVAERLRMSLSERPLDAGGRELPVTLSAGFGVAADASQLDAKRLIEAADRALYAAKNQGRNRVESGSVAPAQDRGTLHEV